LVLLKGGVGGDSTQGGWGRVFVYERKRRELIGWLGVVIIEFFLPSLLK
jgi:hypothetical protein